MVQRDYISGPKKNGIDRLTENTDRLFYGTYEPENWRGELAIGGLVDEIGRFGRLNCAIGRVQHPNARNLG